MKKHVYAKVEVLDLPWNTKVETRRKLQAAFFLAKRYREGTGFDLSAQPGYFFKWCAGPYSDSLNEAFRETAPYGHYENHEVDTSGYDLPAFEVTAEVIRDGPDKYVENGLWARMCAMIAYLESGDWSREGIREEVADALGEDVTEHLDEAYKTLYENDMVDLFNSDQQRERILTQMEKVRQSGEVNMVDASGVQRVAYDKDLHALVSFLGERPSEDYSLLLDEFSDWRAEESIDSEHDYVERALDL